MLEDYLQGLICFQEKGAASLNERAIRSTYRLKNLLVTPGTLFCSWIIVGIPIFDAAYTTAPDTYPPVPITISG